jgi:hexosaminidase
LPHPLVKIEIAKPDPNYNSLEESENYSLKVTSKGVELKADGQAGVLHGLATLQQLIKLTPSGYQFTGAEIEDSPRFAWRGLLIDVARHFVSIETLKRQIDAMEAVKLNVLHLHLSDNEAFRVESKAYPFLHEKASDGQYYTQNQIKDLIRYAADRGVRVVPEFDMPGHSGSEVKAYPELGTPVAGKTPAGELDPSRESTYKFVEGFIDEMSKLFPDTYYHMGGDEVGGGSWTADPHIQEFMKEKGLKDNVELQSYFTNRVKEMLDKRGKKMMGWDEIVNPELSKNVMVHSWRSSQENIKILNNAYPMIVSNGYYLDMLSPAGRHYAVDPTDTRGGNNEENWNDGQNKKPDEPPVKLTPEQAKLIKGGEGAMWSELATDEQMDARIWPRMAAVAERYWSPADTRDVDDMYRRLIPIDNELAVLGLQQHENSDRMVARLAPDQQQVVQTFLSAFRPSTNWSHFKSFRHNWDWPYQQQFNELADAAAPDALRSKQLEFDVKDYLNGKQSPVLINKIQNQFRQWRDNNDQFQELSSISPIFKDAASRSQDLHDLSEAALEAIDMIKSGRKPDAAWLKKQTAILDQQEAYDIATAGMMNVQKMPQPPADLLITIHPAVRMLINAAAK